MLLLLNQNASEDEIDKCASKLEIMGCRLHRASQRDRKAIVVLDGMNALIDLHSFPCIEQVIPIEKPYKLAARESKEERTKIFINGHVIGGHALTVMAGPCSVESEEQIETIAECVAVQGAQILRGGAFKPRTSPYSFQGLGEKALKLLEQAGKRHGLITISEAMDSEHIGLVSEHIDIVQIGARNMQNFSLLKRLGKIPNPIMLKRGPSATYQELLMAAEYILNAGNLRVILCERGIRTFETHTRNTLDLAAVPVLKELSHLPVIVDPSHGTGLSKLVAPMSKAAIAAGADGIMIEVHPDPCKALSDSEQTINLQQFTELMLSIKFGMVGCGLPDRD